MKHIHASEIVRRRNEQKFLIEDKIVTGLIENINQKIREHANNGADRYTTHIPPYVYGFPKYDCHYVMDQLCQFYAQNGFHTTKEGRQISLDWKQT